VTKRDIELESSEPAIVADGEPSLDKKDIERMGDTHQGLENTEHKIVKGQLAKGGEHVTRWPPGDQVVHRIEGDRVYVKLNKKYVRPSRTECTNMCCSFEFDTNEANLMALMEYLQNEIGRPHNVTLSDYTVSGNELSFKVTSLHPDVDVAGVAMTAGRLVPLLHERRHIDVATSVADAVCEYARVSVQHTHTHVYRQT
jgi:hypothetical protein